MITENKEDVKTPSLFAIYIHSHNQSKRLGLTTHEKHAGNLYLVYTIMIQDTSPIHDISSHLPFLTMILFYQVIVILDISL